MRFFGFGKSRSAGARSTNAGRPQQPLGRPSWYWFINRQGRSQAIIPIEKELGVYDDIRRLFPIMDTALDKLTRLIGGIKLQGSIATVAELTEWMERVQVNQVGRGLETWLGIHLDQMLMYGKGVAEIVPNRRRNDIYALQTLDVRTILLRAGATPLDLVVCQRQQGPNLYVELTPGWYLFSVHRQRGDNPHGTSLLRSVPWVCDVISALTNAVAQDAERTAAPSFHVNWKPDAGFVDPDGSLAGSVVDALGSSWAAMMAARKSGDIQDFFTSGDVTHSTIGHDVMHPPTVEHYRMFAEQLVAATGLPAWMLGLNWSTTERLSTVQAEMLLADIEARRREVQPQIEYLIDLRQRLAGKSGRVKIEWEDVTLHDLVEHTRAEAWRETARQQAVERAARMWQLGWWSQLRAGQEVDPTLLAVVTPLSVPPPASGAHLSGQLRPGQGSDN